MTQPVRRLSSKILPPSRLESTLKQIRKKNPDAKITFTNGCFDLLHPGHVTYLERARKLGTHLIVALNTDASVKKLKGPTRPINSLKDRATVIAALESVDFVTWFGQETPLKLILKLRPDILTKGGDWKVSQIVGAKEVLSWGGRVRSLKFIQGKSTTRLIQKARR